MAERYTVAMQGSNNEKDRMELFRERLSHIQISDQKRKKGKRAKGEFLTLVLERELEERTLSPCEKGYVSFYNVAQCV